MIGNHFPKLKLEIESGNWNLKFILEIETLILNIEIQHSQMLKYDCFRFVNIAQFNMVKEDWEWMVFVY